MKSILKVNQLTVFSTGTEIGCTCSLQVNTYTAFPSNACSKQYSFEAKIFPESIVTEPVSSRRFSGLKFPAITCSLQAGNPKLKSTWADVTILAP